MLLNLGNSSGIIPGIRLHFNCASVLIEAEVVGGFFVGEAHYLVAAVIDGGTMGGMFLRRKRGGAAEDEDETNRCGFHD